MKLNVRKNLKDSLYILSQIVSLLLPEQLSPKEMTVLTHLFLLEERYKWHRLSTTARKRLKVILEGSGYKSTPEAVRNTIYKLRDKGVIYKDKSDGVLYIHKNIKTLFETFIYQYNKGETTLNLVFHEIK